MSTHRTPMASRSREPPTPTPFQGGHRAARGNNPLASSTSSIPSSNSMLRGINPLACSTSSISGPGRAPTMARAQPPPAYNLPRPGTARVHTMPQARPLGSSGAHNVAQARSTTHGSITSGIPKISGNTAALLSRDGSRRPRRESFKPRRSSLAGWTQSVCTNINNGLWKSLWKDFEYNTRLRFCDTLRSALSMPCIETQERLNTWEC
jgi:hypothetical protein